MTEREKIQVRNQRRMDSKIEGKFESKKMVEQPKSFVKKYVLKEELNDN
jgi:hypothetical protein